MLIKYYVCTILTLSLVAFAIAAKETLVLLNNLVIKETHSILFNTLRGSFQVFFFFPVVCINRANVIPIRCEFHRWTLPRS